jgi:glycosyltransferase involved in cell wall biosynthesis
MSRSILIAATVARHIEAFHLPYGEELRRRGWTVCAAAQGASRSQAMKDAFHQVFEVPFSRNPLDLRNLRAGLRMREIIRSCGFQLVHLHTPVAAFVTRLAVGSMKKHMGFKILYTAHGFHFHPKGSPLTNGLFQLLEKAASPFTDLLFVMNRYDLQRAYQMKLAPRIELVPGVGVDLSFFDPSLVNPTESSLLLEELGLPGGKPYFLYVAEFSPGKRHCDLVDAMAKVQGDCCLIFVGDGALRHQMEDMVARRGLTRKVKFAGFRSREEVRALLKSSVGAVFPSSREGLPRAVIEAMAMGKLVIGADARGTVDLLEEGRGWLYPVGQTESLANLMDRALKDTHGALDAGRTARDYVVRTMDVRKLVKTYADLCETLAG